MFTETIYISLLNEGTVTWRPTQGQKLEGGTYKVLATQSYDADDEEWEFAPGTIVHCRLEHRDGKEVLMAYAKVGTD